MTFTAVQVLPGPGIVARFGDVMLWAEEGNRGGQPVVARLLDLARQLAESGDGRQAGARAAEVLRTDPQGVPAMVLVAPTPDGLQAVVHGWGRVLADGVDIDGGWVDRELGWTTALAAGRGGDLLRVPAPGSVLDLRRGSTPGGGAAIVLAARDATAAPVTARPPAAAPVSAPGAGAPAVFAPAPAASPSPSPAPSAPSMPSPSPSPSPAPSPLPSLDPMPAPVSAPPADTGPEPSFVRVDLREAPPKREPLPVAGKGGPVAPATGVTVKGVVCSRGHFNNPIALFCSTCGIGMGQVTRILQDGIRPSLGTLVLDDGTAFGLDTDHLIGAAPHADPAVVDGQARPVPVVDPAGQVAPVHAEVRLVGWDVVLVARAPTFVLAPGAQQWAPAPPAQANPLPAGARVAVGQRTFVVESNARNSGI